MRIAGGCGAHKPDSDRNAARAVNQRDTTSSYPLTALSRTRSVARTCSLYPYFTIRSFFTFLTPFAPLASSPALSLAAWELTKPLSCTVSL